ncbi:MAG: protein phosphatase CheZ [Burkholderiaceae bacterium]
MSDQEDLYHHVGRLTRQLHDALRELGYDREIENAVGSLPDARNRLSYISRLTGEAAEKVLNSVDETKAELSRLSEGARDMATSLSKDPVAAVASGRLMCFLDEVGQSSTRADAHLTEIMLAQDFHDLTGQVIRKVVTLAQSLETQLVQLLIASSQQELSLAGEGAATATGAEAGDLGDRPAESKASGPALEGPVVMAAGRNDVVTDQSQVDDLLESLGF